MGGANRSAQEQRMNKCAATSGEVGFTRNSRFSSLKRNAAVSPTPPTMLESLDPRGAGNSNQSRIPSLGDEEDVEEEEEGGEGVMEVFKQQQEEEEEGMLSLRADSRLLRKDFIENKFSLGLVCYEKVGACACLCVWCMCGYQYIYYLYSFYSWSCVV